jgi:hypothetical protein
MNSRRKSIYVETTIPSLATSRPSRDIITAGHQAVTRLFWEQERKNYDVFVSQYVIDECSLGDPLAARRRLDFLTGITILPKSDEIKELGEIYQKLLGIPDKAKTDCMHLAVCVINEIDYLLSWNCAHLGVGSYEITREYNIDRGFWTPMLLTPDALIKTQENT